MKHRFCKLEGCNKPSIYIISDMIWCELSHHQGSLWCKALGITAGFTFVAYMSEKYGIPKLFCLRVTLGSVCGKM